MKFVLGCFKFVLSKCGQTGIFTSATKILGERLVAYHHRFVFCALNSETKSVDECTDCE